ncbi:MAG: tripartite tricarboxylate transporter substrate binding protein [Alphaproteobacteria bacterium]|nr:tripartite tricarboxylate transporter substrate binding protein [Alphaproteobacteria bacterium]
MERRKLLVGASAVGLNALLGPGQARSQSAYPNRSITFIVPSPAGGVYDLNGRLLVDMIKPKLGTIVVDNRSGGTAWVGVTAAARAAPDGYTVLLAGSATHILQPAMMTVQPYDPVKDFSPIATLTASWTCVAINPALPVHNLKELAAYAKDNPGKLTTGFRGIGDPTHLAGELFRRLGGGLDILDVPYRAVPQAINDIVGGSLQMAMPHITSNINQLHQAGKIRLLSLNAPNRIPLAPDLPTSREAGLDGMIAGTDFYLYAPAGTPVPILALWNRLAGAALSDPAFREKLVNVGLEPIFAGDLEQTAAYIEKERQRWTPIVKAMGIKID